MLFDYRTKFENYSNEQLLQVMIQSSQYQQEVVAIAKEILEERGVNIKEALTDHLETMPVTERVAAFNSEIKELTEVISPAKLSYWSQCIYHFKQLFLSKTKDFPIIAFRIATVVYLAVMLNTMYDYGLLIWYLVLDTMNGYPFDIMLLYPIIGLLVWGFVALSLLAVRKVGWYLTLFNAVFVLLALVVRVIFTGVISESMYQELYFLAQYGVLLYCLLSASIMQAFRIKRLQMKYGLIISSSISVLLLLLGYNF